MIVKLMTSQPDKAESHPLSELRFKWANERFSTETEAELRVDFT